MTAARRFIIYTRYVRHIRPFPNWSKREQRRILGWILEPTDHVIKEAAKAKIICQGMDKIKFNSAMMKRLVAYSATYEISFQLWPSGYTIYIAKDGVDLESYGRATPNEAMKVALEYLDRINKNPR